MIDQSGTTALITFLSDFGHEGGYAAACETTIAALAPEARVLHLSHEVGIGDVSWGSLLLARLVPLGPCSIHLAVVDPGVGITRQPIAILADRGDWLVGPDNGLLLPAAEALGGPKEARLLDSEKVRAAAGLSATHLSATFHGRDLFAPAAALLAQRIASAELGPLLDISSLVRPYRPLVEITSDGLIAEVIEIDRFGNVGLSARFAECSLAGPSVRVEIEGENLPAWEARVVQTFGQLHSGELGLYQDSWGQVALALNAASAAQLLSLNRGMKVRITTSPADDFLSRTP